MRLTQLFLTCCLLVSTVVVAQEEASSAVSSVISKIPGGLIGGGLFDTIKIDKKFDLETKDVMINIGKVDIEIEKEIKKIPLNGVAAAAEVEVEDAQQTNLLFPNKLEIDKEIDIKKKDFIVNIGKVKIDIEKKKKLLIAGANAEDGEGTEEAEVAAIPQLFNPNKLKIDKEIDIEKKDFIVNIGKVKVEIEKKKKVLPSWSWPAAQPITWKPTWKYPSIGATADENGQVYDDNTTIPLFEDFTPADEPAADEVVLGENATAVTVQGAEKFDERGVLILTGPQIFSVTFKIVKEKVITMVGSDFNVAGYKKRKPKEAVTFIIRGRGFIPGGGLLFNEIDDVMGGTSKGGLFEFLEPRVFLGAIPLKVVKFTDTVILARFLDFEDQRSFEPGTHLARVKVLHVDLKKEKKKHGPGGEFGILGHDDEQTEIASVGGLVLPALGAIGGSITSGPVLGVVGVDNKKKNDFSQSLLGLFSGLRFDTAVLAVQFSVKDAEKIKGSYWP